MNGLKNNFSWKIDPLWNRRQSYRIDSKLVPREILTCWSGIWRQKPSIPPPRPRNEEKPPLKNLFVNPFAGLKSLFSDMLVCLRFWEVLLEGFKRSGRLVGWISCKFLRHPTSWCQVIVKTTCLFSGVVSNVVWDCYNKPPEAFETYQHPPFSWWSLVLRDKTI